MRVIKSERIITVDIDDTMVMHRKVKVGLEAWIPGALVELGETIIVPDRITDTMIELEVNQNMIRLVKEEKHRGATIVVWSRGGYEWAADVVTALGLEDLVDTVMSKPLVYFDDKPVTEWLTDRVYIGPDENYKSNTYKG